MQWLETPRAIIDAYIVKMEQLRAEECLVGTNVAAIGSRLEPGGWMSETLWYWRRLAGPLTRAAKATGARLSAAGIKLKRVARKPKKKEAPGV